jgi:poly-gamma-glutamate synthesis protein (capsule biosynthesis protein)
MRSIAIGVVVAVALGVLGYALMARAPYASFLQPGPEVAQARVLFVGDLFFDRHIRLMMERHGQDQPFSCLNRLFGTANLVVGNLEGPITAATSVSAGTEPGSPDNFRFTFPPHTAQLLARHGVSVVNLGNNHIGNFGLEGIASTKRHLAEAGVGYFGGLSEEGLVYRATVRETSLAFVSYNEFGGPDVDAVVRAIVAERAKGNLVVVYAHWGEEYVEPAPRVRAAAEAFARAGAALIVGSHPHVVLGSEYIGETLVYWSLGNFIFDQYWEEAVSRGLAVEVVFDKQDVVGVVEHPVELLRDGRTCPIVVL